MNEEDKYYCTACFKLILDDEIIFDVNGNTYCCEEHYEESKEE